MITDEEIIEMIKEHEERIRRVEISLASLRSELRLNTSLTILILSILIYLINILLGGG